MTSAQGVSKFYGVYLILGLTYGIPDYAEGNTEHNETVFLKLVALFKLFVNIKKK